jgi:hypothetical protein
MQAINYTRAASLQDLQLCPNVEALTPAVRGLCSHFGQIDKLTILNAVHNGAHQAICFLRLESTEHEKDLMQALGVGKFAGEIVFIVNLKQADGHASGADFQDFDDSQSPCVAAALPTRH